MRKNSEIFKNIKYLPFKEQNIQLYCADEDECCDGHGVDVTSVVRGGPCSSHCWLLEAELGVQRLLVREKNHHVSCWWFQNLRKFAETGCDEVI